LIGADLYGADLTLADSTITKADLTSVNLDGALMYGCKAGRARFIGAKLVQANLVSAWLFAAELSNADLSGADLSEAELVHASLANASLVGSKLDDADFHHADLTNADLSRASRVGSMFVNSRLDGARVYGTAVWGAYMDDRVSQRSLIITPAKEALAVTVDNIEMVQFVGLILGNRAIGRVLDQLTAKTVLILRRFTPTNKAALDALRDALRAEDFAAIIFDFEPPRTPDLSETIGLLAHMARFVVAEFSDAKSLPQELQNIVPDLPSVPVIPLIRVADIRQYSSADDLVRNLHHGLLSLPSAYFETSVVL
jgi:hypothetical protein